MSMKEHEWKIDWEARTARCVKCNERSQLTPEGVGEKTECRETLQVLSVQVEIKVDGNCFCAEDCPWIDWRDSYAHNSPKCHLFLERSRGDREFCPSKLNEDRMNCVDGHSRGRPLRSLACTQGATRPFWGRKKEIK